MILLGSPINAAKENSLVVSRRQPNKEIFLTIKDSQGNEFTWQSKVAKENSLLGNRR
jgi:hypothetical protein